jgi:hypothetical protein
MKFFLTFFFFLILSFGFSQKKLFSLTLKTDDQNSQHGCSYWQDVKISSKDTNFIYKLHNNAGDKIDSLPAGEYVVTISSVFAQKVTKKVSLVKNETVKFSLEKLNKKVKPEVFSKKMKDGDTLYMLHNATGVYLNQKIGVTKKSGKYSAFFYKGISSEITKSYEEPYDAFMYLQQFEKESVNHDKITGCTALEVYTFRLNGKYYVIKDGTCKWSGFFQLITLFFPKIEE